MEVDWIEDLLKEDPSGKQLNPTEKEKLQNDEDHRHYKTKQFQKYFQQNSIKNYQEIKEMNQIDGLTSRSDSHQSKSEQETNIDDQIDINSIGRIDDGTCSTLRVGTEQNNIDLEWIDELLDEDDSAKQTHGGGIAIVHQQSKMKHYKNAKQLDQLDGLTLPLTRINSAQPKVEEESPEDDKVIKCLYYTLMCCDCTIC